MVRREPARGQDKTTLSNSGTKAIALTDHTLDEAMESQYSTNWPKQTAILLLDLNLDISKA